MSQQQLSLSLTTSQKKDESANYEVLDIQLADLMQALNSKNNQTLKDSVLNVSKQTREGMIAIPCTETQQEELLSTKVVGKAADYKPLILDNGYLYLRRYWQYQQALADQIRSRLEQPEEPPTQQYNNWIKQRLDHYFGNDTKQGETNWQQLAAERALKHNFLILSGGPGTGKTTTITRILALLIEQQIQQSDTAKQSAKPLRILMAAPTGKAAIRMLDAIRDAQQKIDMPDAVQAQIPSHASTLHKLLGYQHQSVQFKHNEQSPLNADVLIIDEASMIDIALMSKLVAAVPAHAKLILIGDKDQLLSVETGSVFTDMCIGLQHSPYLIALKKNWRFKQNSAIGQLAKATNTGDSKALLAILNDSSQSECVFLKPDIISKNKIPEALITAWHDYFEILKNPDSSIAENFEAFNQYQILCALRRGLNGSNILSNRIEKALHKRGLINLGKSQDKSWYHGRPVMITQNSYSKGLFNGDTGITLTRNGKTSVYFPDAEEGQYKSLAPVRLPAHETNWAMTIHKSQGSEFNQVTLILPHEIMPLLSRQLIYTGLTRAKEKVSIIADQEVLVAGVRTKVTQATKIADQLSK